MSLSTIAASAAGFILKAIGKSKVVEKAKDTLVQKFNNELGGLLNWVRPILSGKEEDKLLEKIETAPEEDKTQAVLEFKLEEMMENDPVFAAQLEEKVEKIAEIQNQINISGTNISDAGIVSLGGNVNIEGENVAGHDMTINIDKKDDD